MLTTSVMFTLSYNDSWICLDLYPSVVALFSWKKMSSVLVALSDGGYILSSFIRTIVSSAASKNHVLAMVFVVLLEG